jgi:hypothetical protein
MSGQSRGFPDRHILPTGFRHIAGSQGVGVKIGLKAGQLRAPLHDVPHGLRCQGFDGL